MKINFSIFQFFFFFFFFRKTQNPLKISSLLLILIKCFWSRLQCKNWLKKENHLQWKLFIVLNIIIGKRVLHLIHLFDFKKVTCFFLMISNSDRDIVERYSLMYNMTCATPDPIAVPVIIHRRDLERLAPLWYFFFFFFFDCSLLILNV